MPAPRRTVSLESRDSVEWSRCCDSSSCQARTVRPSSQQLSQAPRRPVSRESNGSSEWGWLRPRSQCRLEGMEQFKRSLRLIGLRPEDVGLESPEPLEYSYRIINLSGAKPKLNTRLEKRTVSADDLRALLEECPVKDTVRRGLLAKAVYEEWYFKKQEEIRRRKEMERHLERGKANQTVTQKKQQVERNKTKFEEWLRQKVAKKRDELNKTPDRKGLGNRTMSNPEQAELAFLTWKRSKEKQHQMERRSSQREVEEELEKQAKRIEAEKAFQHWKMKKEEEMQRVLREKEKLERMIKQDEEKIKQQKIKESEISFKVWKLKKDREIQERVNKIKSEEERKKDDAKREIEERRYEANQAFLGWLDTVEQRERDLETETAGSRRSTPRDSARTSAKQSRSSSRVASPVRPRPRVNHSKPRNKPDRSNGN